MTEEQRTQSFYLMFLASQSVTYTFETGGNTKPATFVWLKEKLRSHDTKLNTVMPS